MISIIALVFILVRAEFRETFHSDRQIAESDHPPSYRTRSQIESDVHTHTERRGRSESIFFKLKYAQLKCFSFREQRQNSPSTLQTVTQSHKYKIYVALLCVYVDVRRYINIPLK